MTTASDDPIAEALAGRFVTGTRLGFPAECHLDAQSCSFLAEVIEPIIKARVVEALQELAGDLSHSISAYDNSTWVSGFESCMESVGDRANWYEAQS